jgi:hypothetical protein
MVSHRPPAAALLWIALAAASTGACGDRSSGAAQDAGRPVTATELDRLVAACVETMVRNTCKVMTGTPAGPAASVVFVAGVGPVDAKTYAELRASGEAMCEVVRRACSEDWNSSQCRTARSLVPAASAPGAK